MGRKASPGLFKRGKYWHIEKQILGHRIRESTGAVTLSEAERYLNQRIEEIRQASLFGVRPKRTFRQAATKFLMENQHKRSIREDALHLRLLDNYIGELPLEAIHMGTLQPFIEARRKERVKNRTINYALQVTRRILNLAAGEWMDGHSLTWLANAPKIKLLPQDDAKPPYPLNWEEQTKLFKELPPHLQKMALFAVNTGCRDKEICSLRWEWEVAVPELNTTVFIIPKQIVKNKHDRLVVLNRIAKSVVDDLREQHPEFVFTFRNQPTQHMNNTAWNNARKRADLPQVRVHDLKHTFGRRLRAAGVGFEDRQDLLGHKSARITTHYSAAELSNLLDAANKVCDHNRNAPTLTVLRKNDPHKIPTMDLVRIGKKVVIK